MTEHLIQPAWRGYYTLPGEGFPRGGLGQEWPAPVKRAKCADCREVPGTRCSCGIYGAYDPAEALRHGPLVALAKPFGRVVAHEGGWRAEWVQVLAIYIPPGFEVPAAWADCERLSIRDVLEATRRAHGSPLRLNEAVLIGADLAAADLSAADLSGADLPDANLREADLRGAHLSASELRNAKLAGAQLCKAMLPYALLWDADLRGADLRGADLERADLQCANLQCANLQSTYCYRADFRGADLRGADFRGADLRGADFRDAVTEYADFRGARLEGARGLSG